MNHDHNQLKHLARVAQSYSHSQRYLTLHRQNSTGRNTATAMVMGMNQLSSEAYGSVALGPDGLLNLWLSSTCSSSRSLSFSRSS